MQRIVPYLSYTDPDAAIAWLSEAFGFEERLRYTEPDGTVSHAELELSGDSVMLSGGDPGEGLVVIEVDDVDVHHGRARGAGAEIVSGPEDTAYGVRRYRARDREGHLWMFGQRIRDVAPAEWGATSPTDRAG
jgi:uncharacterized glyoxalase superfamily protein PhnB